MRRLDWPLVRRAAGGLLAALVLAAPVGKPRAQTTAPPPPIEDFFRVPQLINPVLSPDGRFVAAAIGGPTGRKRLGIIDLERLDDSKIVAGFRDGDVERYQWVNNERLVLTVSDRQNAGRWLPPGLWAVNRDGSDFRQLIKAEQDWLSERGGRLVDRRLSYEWQLHSTLRDGSDDVVVEGASWGNSGEFSHFRLARLDTKTGLTRNLSEGAPENAWHWVLDRQGAPAAVTTHSRGRYASYLKTGSGWQLWEEGDAYKGKFAEPYWIGPKGELLVLARLGSDTDALFQLDRATLKLPAQPVLSLQGYDFKGQPIYDRGSERILGYHYESDARGTAWVDAGMRALQAEIDKLLPGTVNRIDCERCSSVPTVLISASSDRMPPVYYLYQRETRQIQVLGSSRPWIKPAQMGLRDMYRFKARDGLEIPVLVTQPPGKAGGPRPAVVLVHGGPWVRGAHWEWEQHAQFLASRGYVVIEPEFRGSTGYGGRHFRAGWKQWGLAMQDDVADALQWAVGQGWVDPQRACIAGASYGGYATLMGLIKHPELYRCGFQWVGVSDIELMYTISWSDFSADWKGYGMPQLVGDRVKDAQQLKDTSPLAQAQRLKRPLLMAYGGQDRRVPIKHGSDFLDALSTAGNKQVEWIVYPDEGHGWYELKTNIDFWSRVEKFLDRHIGPSARTAAGG
ncbi:alpha/beta hydrolase family protein [Roseateles violae]|uniref:Prolyl oligopeptidase family serine peptidase n=1 Tax=Roseateles violae TaxID=3058042 RepID=A0ABT8DKG3_9BURK|nr:prolyl oligopeptidase family serine peptidase [Pelomonas sp. PFR6]MDN3918911.1 prolyl oligopeptidase family serine peptidase [Pelomonas sp. PFR6]